MLHVAFLNGLWEALRWTWHDPDGYNIVSGPLADITLLGAGIAIYRKHNCHAKGCWRLGRHPVEGTSYITCQKHHPRPSNPTAEQIAAEHHAAKQAVDHHHLHGHEGPKHPTAEQILTEHEASQQSPR